MQGQLCKLLMISHRHMSIDNFKEPDDQIGRTPLLHTLQSITSRVTSTMGLKWRFNSNVPLRYSRLFRQIRPTCRTHNFFNQVNYNYCCRSRVCIIRDGLFCPATRKTFTILYNNSSVCFMCDTAADLPDLTACKELNFSTYHKWGKIFWAKLSRFSSVPRKFFRKYLYRCCLSV